MLAWSPEVRMVVGKTGSKVSGYHHVPAAAVKVAGEGFWLLDLADVLHDLVVLRRALGLPLLQQRDPVLELAGVAVPRHPGDSEDCEEDEDIFRLTLTTFLRSSSHNKC